MARKGRRDRRRFKGPWITDELGIDRGDRITVELGPHSEIGETTAALQDIPISVAGGVPGETVEVEVVRRYPESLATRVLSVENPSSSRVDPPCPHYLECSGCQFQHVNYETQLEFKRKRIEEALAEYLEISGVTVREPLPSPQEYNYRNHARFTVRQSGEIGFVNRHTRQWLRVDQCMLMTESINDAVATMQDHIRGITQMSIRAGVNTDDLLIQPKLPNPAIPLESGGQHYTEKLMGHTFKVAGSSFFQVNSPQAEALASLIAERLALSGKETVIDAYAGVGTFAVLLSPNSGRVIAIEDSNSAVADARFNARGLSNVEFIESRTEDAMAEMDFPVDAVILDPPRTGCHPGTIDAVRRLAPARLAMVSCDPPSLARDLALVCEGNAFAIDEVQPVDMFPQTYHVECVAFLSRSG
jgi:23S rRNA (uracil1939-C5)-methyltransferase